MRLGQVVELLHGRTQAHAGDAPVAHRDQALQGLVALAQRIGLGVQEAEHPGPAVRLEPHESEAHRAQRRRRHREDPPLRAAQEGHEERHEEDEERGAEVRLAQDQGQGYQEDGEEGHQLGHGFPAPLAPQVPVPDHPPGGDEHRDGLEQLGGLEAEAAEPDPPVGVVDGREEEHRPQQEQEHHVEHLQDAGVLPQHGQVGLGEGQHDAHAHEPAHHLVHQEGGGGAVVLEGRGGKDPDHAHGHEGQGEEKEQAINGAADVRAQGGLEGEVECPF